MSVTPAGLGVVHIQAGPFQPVELPAAVLEVLTHFQGQPVEEAKATLLENGIEVDQAFLTKLWECGFLVSAESGGSELPAQK